MKIEKISYNISNENIIYDCGKMNFLIKKKNSISLEHTHSKIEEIFLVEGEIKLSLGTEDKILKVPVKIEIPINVSHKLVALTDIRLLYSYK